MVSTRLWRTEWERFIEILRLVSGRGYQALQILQILEKDTEWQNGPEFMQKDEDERPARFEVSKDNQLIEAKYQKKSKDSQMTENPFVGMAQETDKETLASRIDATRFSKWGHLKAVTARILYLYRKYRRGPEINERQISSLDSEAAEILWIKEAQSSIDIKKCVNLNPVKDEQGVWRVGGRTERWMASTMNRQNFVLLPKDAHVSLQGTYMSLVAIWV